MTDEDDDYMSDKFLENLPSPKVSDLHTRSSRRSIALKRKHTANNDRMKKESVRVLERQRLEEGLNSTINSDNKGMLLMKKLGYTPGTALGKSGEGRLDPVPLKLHSGRDGLGRSTEQQRRTEEMNRLREAMSKTRKLVEAKSLGDFSRKQREKHSDREILRELHNAQKVCEQLDSREGKESPVLCFYWPEYTIPEYLTEKLAEEQEEFEISEQLHRLCQYLRQEYFYCIYCAVHFTDAEDMASHCPGETADDHD